LPISAKTASATLVVGDVGYRVQMTSASATTITVNTGIFSAGDTIWIQNIGAGVCTITAGTATVGTASSLALAQYGGGTLVFQSASAATFFSQQSASYGVATGGTSSSITVSGVNYTLLRFTTDSSLVVSRAGLFDALLVGGGSGGWYGTVAGGGGAAGGLLQQTIYLTAATYTVDIGAGGSPVTAEVNQSLGLPTTLGVSPSGLTAVGGLYQFLYGSSGATSGVIGSLGGAINSQTAGGSNNVQGYKGGNSTATTNAGAGGGAGSVGGNGATTVGGTGGTGFDASAFRGEVANTTRLAGGGGGGASVTQGSGTDGGGNAGAVTGSNGTANTGGGGGGVAAAGTAGSGSSGVLLVRFKV
jgi:hypothetical protein